MKNVAILGFGVVGSGVAEILTQNKDIIEKRIGSEYNLKAILDLREFPGNPFESLITHDFKQIVDDPTIGVVAEMMGGSHPAYEFSKACLKAGKSVVTSNKEVVANFGVELSQIAKEHHVSYLFEASVGGGIPIIHPLLTDLVANRIQSISGILNGTTNYILTKMKNNGTAYSEALAEAQKLGYAEKNPTADVEGLDAARKIVILTALAFGKMVRPTDIHVEGITQITVNDMNLAEQLGCSIKLIGYTTCQNGKVLAMVSPRLVPLSKPIATIEDVYNGIMVDSDMLGTALFYGRGAGKLPTASAVVADIANALSHPLGATIPTWENATCDDLLPFEHYRCKNCLILDQNLASNITKDETVVDTITCNEFGTIVITKEVSEEEIETWMEDNRISTVKRIRFLE